MNHPPPIVVLHERSGTWSRQLRARLHDVPVRWIETRSTAELLTTISALTSPVVLVEAARDPSPALRDLAILLARGSAPRTLFLDPGTRREVVCAAREIGATWAPLDRVTPPEVAAMIARWLRQIELAITAEGWTRPIPADPGREPSAWVEEVVAEAASGADSCSSPASSSTMIRRSDRDRNATD